MGDALVAHIPTKKNLTDLLKKVLYGQSPNFLVDWMFWDINPVFRVMECSGQGMANDWPSIKRFDGITLLLVTFT